MAAAMYAAPSAMAGTAGVVAGPDASTLKYRAAPGERNEVSVGPAGPGSYLLTDRVAVIAGPGCEPGAAGGVVCTLAANAPATASVWTGDRNDDVRFDRVPELAREVRGGTGADSIQAAGSRGGFFKIWEIYALSASDPRIGPAAFAAPAHAPATVIGGPGDDVLNGGLGDDVISPGAGNDLVRGSAGDDRVLARDGSFDSVACNAGRDRVEADELDFVWNRCGRVRRTGPALAMGLVARLEIGTTFDFDLDLFVGCPFDAPRACKGDVTLSVRNGPRVFTGPYRAARGGFFDLFRPIADRAGEELVEHGALLSVTSRDRLGRLRSVSRRFGISDPYEEERD